MKLYKVLISFTYTGVDKKRHTAHPDHCYYLPDSVAASVKKRIKETTVEEALPTLPELDSWR